MREYLYDYDAAVLYFSRDSNRVCADGKAAWLNGSIRISYLAVAKTRSRDMR